MNLEALAERYGLELVVVPQNLYLVSFDAAGHRLQVREDVQELVNDEQTVQAMDGIIRQAYASGYRRSTSEPRIH